jgi:magnesium and cobalt transporter
MNLEILLDIITTTDILEEVVGKFAREGEIAGFVIEQIGNKQWRVSGTARIEDFQRHCPDFISVVDVDTIGGLVVAKSEVVPSVGSFVLQNGFKLTVLKADERRVYEVLIEKIATQ